MKIDNTIIKKRRDDTVHNCDLIFFTNLTITDDAYKNNKKNIEERLLQLNYIKEPLPKYSKKNSRIVCLVTHRITDFKLKGFVDSNFQENSDFEKVERDCRDLLNSCFFKNEDRGNFHECAAKSETEKFDNQKEILKKLQFIASDYNNEVVETFLVFANEISQCISAIPKDLDFFHYIREYMNNESMLHHPSYDRFKQFRYAYFCDLNDYQINSLINNVNFTDVDKEFKISETFLNKEQEYSKEKDIHLNFNLNKKIDISLTSNANETKEDLIERAKESIIKELSTQFFKDQFKKDNLSLINSNLVLDS